MRVARIIVIALFVGMILGIAVFNWNRFPRLSRHNYHGVYMETPPTWKLIPDSDYQANPLRLEVVNPTPCMIQLFVYAPPHAQSLQAFADAARKQYTITRRPDLHFVNPTELEPAGPDALEFDVTGVASSGATALCRVRIREYRGSRMIGYLLTQVPSEDLNSVLPGVAMIESSLKLP